MIMPAATARVVITLADRDHGKARISFRLPFSISASDAAAVRSHIIGLMLPLTDARVIGTQIVWEYSDATPTLPAFDVKLQTKGVLFYRNATRAEAFYIPAPKPSLYETTGEYAGIRIDMSNPTIAAAINAISAELANTVTIEGLSFPDEYMVGGLVL